jgi:hypothetical protein
MSKGEWVRRALEASLQNSGGSRHPKDALARLTSLNAPTGDIDQILSEIEAGRS